MIGLMNQSKTLIKEKVKDGCNILHFHLENQNKKYSYHYTLSWKMKNWVCRMSLSYFTYCRTHREIIVISTDDDMITVPSRPETEKKDLNEYVSSLCWKMIFFRVPLSTLVSSKIDSAPVSACQLTKMNLDELRQKDRKTKR